MYQRMRSRVLYKVFGITTIAAIFMLLASCSGGVRYYYGTTPEHWDLFRSPFAARFQDTFVWIHKGKYGRLANQEKEQLTFSVMFQNGNNRIWAPHIQRHERRTGTAFFDTDPLRLSIKNALIRSASNASDGQQGAWKRLQVEPTSSAAAAQQTTKFTMSTGIIPFGSIPPPYEIYIEVSQRTSGHSTEFVVSFSPVDQPYKMATIDFADYARRNPSQPIEDLIWLLANRRAPLLNDGPNLADLKAYEQRLRQTDAPEYGSRWHWFFSDYGSDGAAYWAKTAMP
jgi:hypothetical protein